MYVTYQYIADAIIGRVHIVNKTIKVCENTLLEDANLQMQRMVDSGIPAADLFVIFES